MQDNKQLSAGKHPARGGFFRRVDWLTFFITFACVWVGYYLTLAPELTLEDSGELAAGSFYAGIPHPPGYPVWTLYTWLWTVLVPFKNIAWRVALGEATGGALAAGLLGLLVSRGSGLLMSGIEELRRMQGRWADAIGLVSGAVAGMLLGYNGFMWSQSVIVEVYSFSVASFMVVLVFLLRWIYSPRERRYLYYALFFHGIAFTNHQTLIVAAMGIEVAIAAADFRLGRNLFLGNSIIYLAGLILKQRHILTALEANPAVFVIFNVVGVASIAAYLWFVWLTGEGAREVARDVLMAVFFTSLAASPAIGLAGWALAAVALAGFVWFAWQTRALGTEWLVVLVCGVCWLLGAAFYFYLPLAGMTNPPMQWGYPRTVEGFIHAFTRGQYEKTSPTDILHDPLRLMTQLSMLGAGILEEFNWVYALIALVPFLFFLKLHRRERAWLVGLFAIYLCLGVLLLILLNPPPDRAAQELVRVFFTASHLIIALLVGYGLTLIAAYMAAQYQQFRFWGLAGGGMAVALALVSLAQAVEETYFGAGASIGPRQLLAFLGECLANRDQYALPVYAGLLLIGMASVFVVAVGRRRQRAPLALTLGLFALMPVYSISTHWSDNEQRNHWFGYWFGHDMFSPPFKDAAGRPLYPEMERHAVLYGGTDPGRFCPTYMIFCDSQIRSNHLPKFDPDFDRRDVYIITQNALADGTYLNYIRAHYNRSAQFDPPFFQDLLRSEKERIDNRSTNFLARSVIPLDRFFTNLGDRIEKRRRTFSSWFQADHFVDLEGLRARLRPGGQPDKLSAWLFANVSPETQALIKSNGRTAELREALGRDLNRILDREPSAGGKLATGEPLYTPERFARVRLSEYLRDFLRQNPRGHSRVRLNRLLLEAAYPGEIARSQGGVYPDREIHITTPEESQECFQTYMMDAQKRLLHDERFPNEPKQVRPNEGITLANNRVQISGQVAVMAVNGLIAKVMFDKNPRNEFYVEESYPLDWMYPHLTPFGIIMKINREPVAEMTEAVVQRDHEFWSQYSARLIGNWVTYETPVKEIAAFAERVYLRRNFRGFRGDRKFIRDDQAQKAFSKLRSAIGGLYAWRISQAKPGSAEQQRLIKEADFAFRQAFAFCPYSPEAVYRYVNLLLLQQRFEDALLVAETCWKLDPNNRSIEGLVAQIKEWMKHRETAAQAPSTARDLERSLKANPDDFQTAFNLAGLYLQMGETGKATALLDRVQSSPKADAPALRALFQAWSSISRTDRLEAAVRQVETLWRQHPANAEAGIILAEGYRELNQPERAARTRDQILAASNASPNALLELAQAYAQAMDFPRLENALEQLSKAAPGSPEAWYDLAAIKASLGKDAQALEAVARAFALSRTRRQADARAKDLIAAAEQDPRFTNLKRNPEYQKLAR